MKAKITDTLVRKLKPSPDGRYEVRDTDLTGFLLRVEPSGRMTYWANWSRGRRKKIGPAPAVTPSAARAKAKDILSRAALGQSPEPRSSAPTLAKFVEDEYAPHFKLHHRDEKNLHNLRRFKVLEPGNSRRIAFNFQAARLDEITPELLKDWRAQRLRDGASPATVNRNIAALRACLSYAVERELLERNPATGLGRLRVDVENRVRHLPDTEEARLRDTLDAREDRMRAKRREANAWRAERGYPLLPDLYECAFADHLKPMVLVALNTGIRWGELVSLSWVNVSEFLRVEATSAKSRRSRSIPLNREAKATLESWRQQVGSNGFVFASRTGEQIDNVRKSWGAVLKAADIRDFRWHDLRHTFASKLAVKGVPLNTIRELLGHSDLSMTMRYAHLSPTHTRAAVELLDG